MFYFLLDFKKWFFIISIVMNVFVVIKWGNIGRGLRGSVFIYVVVILKRNVVFFGELMCINVSIWLLIL